MLSRVRYAGLLLLLLLILSLFSGCTIGKSSGTGQAGPQTQSSSTQGIEDITARNPPKVSLAGAMSSLAVAEKEGGIDLTGKAIHQVFGYGVDSAGLARTWVLGMEREGKTTLLAYNEGEWKELDMEIRLPASEVKVQDLLSPEDIFRMNLNTIVKEMNRLKINESDLSLSDETYQVTIHSPTDSKILFFSAKTGELTQSA
ncbi:MAG TPA: hypothetical protein VMS81_04470 [Methanomicrobiales archaeon]|jgi:hypothetical protein|nr:hypothetical protein [Methanomicrobiales archaeon]